MKRDSIIILMTLNGFHTETSDNPSITMIYWVILTILLKVKSLKLLSFLNSEEIGATKNLIYSKFKLNQNKMVSAEGVIDSILKRVN